MRIGPYEVLGELGRGGVGAVFRALAPTGEEVAVKVLHKVDAETLKRFERERELVAELSARDGFVPILDGGECEAGPYLVMPLLRGGTLRDVLERGRLDVEETIALGEALAAALGCAHARGIVHRDLKPENVLFEEPGRPLVADLGLAKHFTKSTPGLSRSQGLSRSGEFRGTFGYAPPEQLKDSKNVGPEADVFALGAILYECLSGLPAFPAENIVELIARVAKGAYEPLEKVRPGSPDWLISAIERSLETDPKRRPNVLELGRLLSRGAPARRGRKGVVVVLAVIASGSLIVGAWQLSLRARAERFRAAVAASAAALAAHDARGALGKAEVALAIDPSSAEVWCALGEAHRESRDYARAIEDFTRAIALDPSLAQAWVGRGDTHSERREYDAAIRDTSRAIELAPGLARAWKERGVARCFKGDRREGMLDFDRALALDPSLARAWYNRGAAKHELGDEPGAIADLTRSIELEPAHGPSWYWRALARVTLDPAEAVKDATRAIELGDANAWEARARARVSLGDFEAAIADATKSLELDPHAVESWSCRSLSKVRRGDFDGAIEDANRGLELEPRKLQLRMSRAVALIERGRPGRAIEDLDAAIAVDPRNVDAWAFRGAARLRAGGWSPETRSVNEEKGKQGALDALSDLNRAIELKPEAALPWANRGHAKALLGDTDGAKADYVHFLELAPGDRMAPQVRDALAKLRRP